MEFQIHTYKNYKTIKLYGFSNPYVQKVEHLSVFVGCVWYYRKKSYKTKCFGVRNDGVWHKNWPMENSKQKKNTKQIKRQKHITQNSKATKASRFNNIKLLSR